MKTRLLRSLFLLVAFSYCYLGFGQAPNLGTTASYAFFTAAGAFSNISASTTVTGNVGTKAGAFTAFPPGTLVGQKHVADPASVQAAIDVAGAYADLSAVNCGPVLTTTLGSGQVLSPNVYCLGAATTINGSLTLDGGGNSNALFIFKIDGPLATSTLSSVTLINGASICNVYWQVNGEVDLGDGSTFQGTIVADGAINLLGNASLLGRGLTTAGAISLQNNIVVVPVQPVASIITASGSTTVCQGNSVTISDNVGGTWNNGATTSSITTDTSGDFYVTNQSNCGNAISNHIIVTVNPLPVTPTITAGGPISFCAGGSVTLSGNTSGGTWSTGATTPTITVTTDGSYSLTNTNACGSATSNIIVVSVNPLPSTPVIVAEGPTSFCTGGSVTLSGNTSGGTWSTGATSSSITVSAAGSYSVTNTNACGSATSNIIVVAVNQPPLTPVITAGGPLSFCTGGSVTLSGNTSGGTWSTGATSSSITVSAGGTYSLTNTNACGSATSNIIVVSVNPPPATPVIVAGGPISFCSGGSVTLSGNTSGGTWSTGATTSSITVSAAGSYSLTNTNACGSATSNIIVVSVNQPPATPVIVAGGPVSFCTGGSVTLSGNTSGGTWSTGATSSSITVSAGGTYSLTNTNACGSATSNIVVVSVNPPPATPVIVAGGPISFCTGGSVTLSGNTSGGTWSTGATTSSITVSAAGSYSLTNTNACGSATSNIIVVSVNPPPATPVIVAGGPVSFCTGGSVTLSGNTSGGTWSTGATTSSIIVSAAGSYSLTNTNACGSANSNIIVVSVNPPPATPVIVAGGPVSFCTGGSVTLSGNTSGGTWSTGATTSSITVSAAGSYSLTNTNACGSATSNIIVVSVGTAPLATAGSNTTICGGKSATLGTTAITGHTYLWTPSTGLSSATISNPFATPTITTTYTLTETITATGCKKSNSVTITVGQAPVSTITGATSTCSGTPITLCAPAGCITYLWSTGATTSCITVTAAGTYSVTVSNAAGCTSTSSVTVTTGTAPLAITGSNTTICGGKNVTLGTTAITGHTYLWTPSTGLSSATISNPVATPTTTTTYTLTEAITATGCKKSNSVTVTVGQAPVSTITGATSTCSGTPITLCAPAGCITYLWSTGATTSCITVSAAGTYSVTVSNAAGCTSTSSVTVTTGTAPLATAGSNTTICGGKSVTLGTTAITGHTYLWTPSTGLSSATTSNPVATPTITTIYTLTETITATGCKKSNSVTVTVGQAPVSTITGATSTCSGTPITLCAPAGCITYLWSTGATTSCITVSAAGTYSVTVSNAAGCTSTSSVTVTTGTAPLATAGSNTTICGGKSVTLGTTAITGHTYLWTPSTGLSSATTSNPVATPTITTIYTLTETITATGCKKSNSVTVTVGQAPVSTITGATSTCSGTPITLCAPAGCITYLWSTGATTSCITVSAAGTYSVTVSNAAGCTSTSSVTVTTGTAPLATTGSNTTICGGKSVTLGTTAITGHTYSWTPSAGLSSATASNPVATPTITTTYTLTETITATGCKKSNSVTVTVGQAPVSTITGATSTCSGTPITLCAPAGCITYLWSTGAKTSCITVTAAGTYSVTVSNAAGCTSTSSVTVTTGTAPLATTGSNTTICGGKSVTLGTTAITGHTYLWTPSTGLSSATTSNPVATPTITTAYTLTETITATGCKKSNSVTVTINPLPSCLISGNTTICAGQSTQLCAPAGCNSYLWSTGAKTSCITVTASGTYSVTVSNSTGCLSTCSKTVTVVKPITCVISGNNYCSAGQSTQLCAPAGCSGYLWSTGAKTSCITVTTGGNYSCTVTNAGGCTSAASKTVSNTVQAASIDEPSAGVHYLAAPGDDTADQKQPMRLEVFPNPSETFFTLIIHSESKATAEIRVIDVMGRGVAHMRANSGEKVQFGGQLFQGIYIVEVLQGNERKTIKVLKL